MIKRGLIIVHTDEKVDMDWSDIDDDGDVYVSLKKKEIEVGIWLNKKDIEAIIQHLKFQLDYINNAGQCLRQRQPGANDQH